MSKCDKCGEQADHFLHSRKFYLCEKCSNDWSRNCQVNGISGGKRNWRLPLDSVKYWEHQFNRFLREGKRFVFR
jgi:hypothetical protein